MTPSVPRGESDVRRPDELSVVIGGVPASAGLVSGTIHQSVNDMPEGQLRFANEFLLNAPLDFRAEVVVEAESRGKSVRIFTGQIDTVEPGWNETKVSLVGGNPELREVGIGGLGADRISDLELVWSMLRSGGLEESNIKIEGFAPGPREIFEVVVPLTGLDIDRPLTFGNTRISSSERVRQLAAGLGPEGVHASFRDASHWAHALVIALTSWDAEIQGVQKIETAIAWLMLRAQYSSPKLPVGGPKRFKRDWTRARVISGDTVLVHGTASGRRWLRARTDLVFRPDLDANEVQGIDVPAFSPEVPYQIVEAIHAWRRAMEEKDSVAALGQLWEAIEFYCAGISVPALVSRETLAQIQEKATSNLQGEIRDRVKAMVGRVNEPPLMVRFRAALEKDEVTITDYEMRLFEKLRRQRNDLVHGRARTPLIAKDLRHGLAVVNRFLLHRMHRKTYPRVPVRTAGLEDHNGDFRVF